MLAQVDAPDVRVYVVWEPILPTDREPAARQATVLITDRRASHLWAPDLELARAFRAPLGLTREAAWDVYLVYDRQAEWAPNTVPVPIAYQHQLRGLPDDKRLDEESLTARLRDLLQSSGRAERGGRPDHELTQNP
ncbi:MAG: hypothetical protein ABIP29_12205 [Candidatus Eisenbacteria bacterium]